MEREPRRNPLDRLDVLGLDREGRLVVAELKRDMAPESVSSQVITYAALVSRFTPDEVTDEYLRTVEKRTGETLDREKAAEQLQGHCNNQMAPETLTGLRPSPTRHVWWRCWVSGRRDLEP